MSRLVILWFPENVILRDFMRVTLESSYYAVPHGGVPLSFDVIFVTTVVLLVTSVVTLVLYYRRMRRVNERYEEARNVVKDIVISFNSQLRSLEGYVKKLAYKLESLPARGSESGDVTAITNQIKKHEKKLGDITSKVNTMLTLKEHLEKLSDRITRIEEEQTKIAQQIAKPKETPIEGVIPIRRDQALAPLTPTELHVLEILADEGQKTAPEIRNRIGLTREHTARLMKKLYEKGYIERNETKTPYIYRIKEEMREILKKTTSAL